MQLGAKERQMKVKQTRNAISPRMKRIRRELDKVPKKAYTYFKSITPIDTGNARRNTKFKKGDTIHADYKYAVPLNEGHSRQAKQGMTNPTIKYVISLVRRIIKGR